MSAASYIITLVQTKSFQNARFWNSRSRGPKIQTHKVGSDGFNAWPINIASSSKNFGLNRTQAN